MPLCELDKDTLGEQSGRRAGPLRQAIMMLTPVDSILLVITITKAMGSRC